MVLHGIRCSYTVTVSRLQKACNKTKPIVISSNCNWCFGCTELFIVLIKFNCHDCADLRTFYFCHVDFAQKKSTKRSKFLCSFVIFQNFRTKHHLSTCNKFIFFAILSFIPLTWVISKQFIGYVVKNLLTTDFLGGKSSK